MLKTLADALEKVLEDEDGGFAYASYGADVCIQYPEKLARFVLEIVRDGLSPSAQAEITAMLDEAGQPE